MRKADVHGNPVQPGRKLAPELEFLESPVDPQEHFLVDVLGIVGACHILRRDGEDLPVVAEDQLFERQYVALLGPQYQMVFFRVHAIALVVI
jgi:hypothetical protein